MEWNGSNHQSSNMASRMSSQQSKSKDCKLRYSLDVLTDGSEQTHPTIFLTISRPPLNHIPNFNINTTPDAAAAADATANTEEEDIETNSTILARYTLSGISTLTSRLAADQNLKLSPIRAVFVPSRPHVPCTSGIPSLLLSLMNYSLTGSLFVVGDDGMDGFMEDMVGLVLGKRCYPTVQTCVVPSKKNGCGGNGNVWWKVYDDEYIIVHARLYDGNNDGDGDGEDSEDSSSEEDNDTSEDSSSESSNDSKDSTRVSDSMPAENVNKSMVVYIITIRQNHSSNITFAILPPHVNASMSSSILHPLPRELIQNCSHGASNLPLEFILHVGTRTRTSTRTSTSPTSIERHMGVKIHSKIRKMARVHLITSPNEGGVDDGLLIRSKYQGELLHSHLPFAFPFASAFTSALPPKRISLTNDLTYINGNGGDTTGMIQRIQSCTTILIDGGRNHGSNGSTKENHTLGMKVICRKGRIREKATKGQNDDGASETSALLKSMQEDVLKLASFYSRNASVGVCMNETGTDGMDGNEIIISGNERDQGASNPNNPISNIRDDDEIDLSEDEDDSETDGCPDVPPPKRRKDDDSKESNCKLLQNHLNVGTNAPKSIGVGIDVSTPHLLVLGTGCASPAPLRGSSGYAIFLPTIIDGRPDLALSIVMECGEGYLTMLSRYNPSRSAAGSEPSSNFVERCLLQIRLIWISHAHLDHYGDLPNLVDAIRLVNGGAVMCSCYEKKRSYKKKHNSSGGECHKSNHALCNRCGGKCLPIVIAPPKVLRFLDNVLDSKNRKERIYIGISQRDFDSSPFSQQVRDDVHGVELLQQRQNDVGNGNSFAKNLTYRPIQFLKNIPVEHCPNAYACLLGLAFPSNANHNPQKFFTICYSGDTRPSSNIIRACRDFSASCKLNVSLLLHEATFDDDDKGKQEAKKKRHSTVKEAMGIGHKIDLDAILLTHFSQRYPRAPPGHQSESNPSDTKSLLEMASAYDGMLVPLIDGLQSVLPALGTLATLITAPPLSDN